MILIERENIKLGKRIRLYVLQISSINGKNCFTKDKTQKQFYKPREIQRSVYVPVTLNSSCMLIPYLNSASLLFLDRSFLIIIKALDHVIHSSVIIVHFCHDLDLIHSSVIPDQIISIIILPETTVSIRQRDPKLTTIYPYSFHQAKKLPRC